MGSIFSTLFSLKLRSHNQPLEDYFTEIFAYCLKENPEVLQDFLATFFIRTRTFDTYQVDTQISLKALSHHETDSRPDMGIYLDDQIIYIENKIGSSEGENQLSRYAEHLDIYEKTKTIVYITKEYEPKEKEAILEKCNASINYIQIRWYQIYDLLIKYIDLPIIKEILEFMNDIGLSVNNQFNPVDLLAMSNFHRLRKLLDESMHAEVSERFEEVLGKKSQKSTYLTQLKEHDRYIYYADQGEWFWVGLGYWFNSKNPKPYPELGVIIEVPPKISQRPAIIGAFKKISSESESWAGVHMDDPSAWTSIRKMRSLQSFLSSENHINDIKEYFLQCIEEISIIKVKYPEMPWKQKV